MQQNVYFVALFLIKPTICVLQNLQKKILNYVTFFAFTSKKILLYVLD